jgi:hypothetical protein
LAILIGRASFVEEEGKGAVDSPELLFLSNEELTLISPPKDVDNDGLAEAMAAVGVHVCNAMPCNMIYNISYLMIQ